MTDLLKTLAAMETHSDQDQAVADHLMQYGEINRDWAYMTGLPTCGRIKNLGGRIHELRKAGWDIKTESNPTRYVLISAPKPRQLAITV